ncbi:MAG TPA: dihydrofolate reductase family protein [Anaerolineales bacterium]|nr:dihydrofolate reductase family protein [Anaerolineales bacterium]
MSKIIASVSITLDGIFSGPQGDEENMINWALPGVQDTMMDNLAMFQKASAILMGRVTYEGFAGFWPFQEGDWADAMNKTKKYVAADKGKLKEVQWGDFANTIELIDGDVEKRVKALKEELKGDIIVSASSKLVQSLLNAGLIDEFHTIVHPVILGSGKRYLDNLVSRHDLKVMYTRFYEQSGCMLFHYQVQ